MHSADQTQILLERLRSQEFEGRPLMLQDRLASTRQLYEYTPIPSLEPYLPAFFSFRRKPYTLADYCQFSPLFFTMRPQRQTWKCSRQVGKSLSTAGLTLSFLRAVPNFSSLCVTPLGNQIKRLSMTYYQSLLENMPMPSLMSCKKNTVYRKDFRNGSALEFSFASASADRIRGIVTDMITFDEAQDFDLDNFSIIEASASASEYGFFNYMGTPKSLDNTMHSLWSESSQAEWCIPCTHCKEENIPALDYHLEAMIGPWHEDISEETPGIICHKCKKPIYPRTGYWLHRYKERRMFHAGYHISQPILPLHYANRGKWFELKQRQEGVNNTSYAAFCNESLGESIDAGQKLVSVTDLARAGSLGFSNRPDDPAPEVLQRRGDYAKTILAVDWGGGGKKLVSFTTLAYLGMRHDGRIDCLWGKRLFSSQDHVAEAQECLHWVRKLRPDKIAHDYTGAGTLRETFLQQSGIPPSMIIPVQYSPAATQNIVIHVPSEGNHMRQHWVVDRTRGLLYVIQSLKTGVLRFFSYDGSAGSMRGASVATKMSRQLSLMDDFLALVEEKVTSDTATDRYMIRRDPAVPDDFAQAVMIGCVMLWYMTQRYPNFANIPRPDTADQQLAFEAYDDGIPGKL